MDITMKKCTTEDIKARFDQAVDGFSNAETGQTSMMDAALSVSLFEQSVANLCSEVQSMCDIGCGAGNFTLRALRRFPDAQCTLIDLSANMLDRAQARVTAAGGQIAERIQNDIRQVQLPENKFDLVVASAVLHHLRKQQEWQGVLSSIYRALKPGGIFWVWDLIKYDNPALQALQTARYADYLIQSGGEDYQKEIFGLIEAQDTPESTAFLFRTLDRIGFSELDIVHKNALFCAMYAKK